MGLTVDEAVTYVQKKLSSDSVNEWSTDEIKEALAGAMDMTLKEYVSAGGDGLTEQVKVTTDATGAADLSAYSPVRIYDLAVQSGTAYQGISPAQLSARNVNENSVRTLRITMVRGYTPSDTGDTALLQGGVARNAIALERLICLRAAEELLVNDGADNRPLVRTMERYEKAAFKYFGVEGSLPHVGSGLSLKGLADRSWWYNPATEAVQLYRVLR